MAAINLGTLRRPGTASIFATDPATMSSLLSIVLTDIAIPIPTRVRLDTLKSATTTRSANVARSPVERAVADNIQGAPETVTIVGTLSATPLGLVASRLGGFGSVIRRDIIEIEKLRRIMDLGEPVALVIPARAYPSMAITSLVETHPGSNKIDLSITFAELRIVSPLAIAGVLDMNAMLVGAGSTSNAGAQATTQVAADVGGGLGG